MRCPQCYGQGAWLGAPCYHWQSAWITARKKEICSDWKVKPDLCPTTFKEIRKCKELLKSWPLDRLYLICRCKSGGYKYKNKLSGKEKLWWLKKTYTTIKYKCPCVTCWLSFIDDVCKEKSQELQFTFSLFLRKFKQSFEFSTLPRRDYFPH